MRSFFLILGGPERKRSPLIKVKPGQVEERKPSLMNPPTSRADYVCMMTSHKVGAFLVFK